MTFREGGRKVLLMKTFVRPHLSGICALVALFAVSPAHSQIWDFNTPGQLAADFYAGSQGAVGTQAASGGLNNSGWVENGIIAGGRGFEVVDQAFSGLTSDLTMSIYFQWQTNTIFAAESLQLGLGRSTNPDVSFSPVGGNTGLNAPVSTQALSVGIGPRTVANDVRIYVSTMTDGSTTNLNQPGSPVATLADGNWYFLEVNFSLLGSNDGFAYTVELFNSSNTGVVSGSSLLSYSSSFVNAGLTAGDLNAYFGSRNAGQYGITGVDNFYVSAIPEPSVAVLSLLGLVGLALRRRRA